MKKIKTAVQIERQDAFLLESDEDLGSLESKTKRKQVESLNDENTFSIKSTVVEKEKTISCKKTIKAVLILIFTLLVITSFSCIKCKQVPRETLRALGDTSDQLPIYLPVVKTSCKKGFSNLLHNIL